MTPCLPDEIVDADLALHSLFQRVVFSRYLNPVNVEEARQDFLAGSDAPPFQYIRPEWAPDALALLNRIRVPTSHPFGPLLQDAVVSTRLLVEALQDRSKSAFDDLLEYNQWRPDSQLMTEAQNQVRKGESYPFVLDANALKTALEGALVERDMLEWRVELDPVMSARVLVDSAKKVLRVNATARFRQRDPKKLIAHEIDVHALRSNNGQKQELLLFSTGLPGSLETEEGLALYAEECVGAASPGMAWRQGLVVQAVAWAETMGFRELFERLAERGGRPLAWGISLRVKRGLKNPGEPGVYGKDVVYFRGLRTVRNWLANGGGLANLYVGKVGVHHPISEWLDAGLIQPGTLPQLFDNVRDNA